MKSIFVILSFLFALNLNAQFRSEFSELQIDTIGASDTIYHYVGGTSWATARSFIYPSELVVLVQTDSLSGATGATILVQYCIDDDCSVLYNAGTLTVNGAASQQLRVEDLNFIEQKARVRCISPSGTQATKIQTVWAVKRRG